MTGSLVTRARDKVGPLGSRLRPLPAAGEVESVCHPKMEMSWNSNGIDGVFSGISWNLNGIDGDFDGISPTRYGTLMGFYYSNQNGYWGGTRNSWES